MKITEEKLAEYGRHLTLAEREPATVRQYMRAVSRLADRLSGRAATKELLMEYKEQLKTTCAAATVNATIAAINGFFAYFEQYGLRLKFLRQQRRIFADPERELSRSEYEELLNAARRTNQTRLGYIVQTIFATGIRVSELRYITVEAVAEGTAKIDSKGKHREVFLPDKLRRKLTKYAKKRGITAGSIFITRSGRPVDRSNIAKGMKRLAELAHVLKKKVFPHNLRHLFARIYYSAYKDIARLADILGHSSINTTRIYTMESGAVHRRQIEHLRLV